MDSLKSLMDCKEYELVIKITNNAEKPDDLFYRISALLATGKYQEALDCLEKNKLIIASIKQEKRNDNIDYICNQIEPLEEE